MTDLQFKVFLKSLIAFIERCESIEQVLDMLKDMMAEITADQNRTSV